MITEKIISSLSSEIEVERPKKFNRKSIPSIQFSRTVSKQKQTPLKIQNEISTTNGNESSMKKMTESSKFDRTQEILQIALKKTTESLKFDLHRDTLQYSQLKKNLYNSQKESEVQSLRSQCRRLRLYLNEQRQQRRLLQQEISLSHISIKRLQRRLAKYKKQKEILQRQREQMYKHVQQLEQQKLSVENKTINSYKLSLMEEQVKRLKEYIQKNRSERQQQLLKQIEQLNEEKYSINKHINTYFIAIDSLTKQISELERQLEQIRLKNHQRVISSVGYVQLRQRYKILLVQHKELKQQMRQLMNDLSSDDLKSIEFSFQTISNNSLVVQ